MRNAIATGPQPGKPVRRLVTFGCFNLVNRYPDSQVHVG